MNHIARLIALTTLTGSIAFAQQAPPPPPAQGAPDQQPHGRMGGGPGGPARGMEGRHEGMRGGMRGEGRIVPPGMWWKNPELATRIGLTADQTKKMDDIFLQARIKLIHMKASLEEEELLLEPLINANPPDSAKALAQIGRIADTRADLEKANAGMLLSIRAVLTPDQWTKLHEHSEREHRGPGGPGRPGMGMLEVPNGPAMAMMPPSDAESAQ
ncbi:protein refolding chaperone Spy/CpxP family [Granulicella pectinivorans]|uniref:Protein refolding chaperone Spy/CpxP family n=1 Tax=Granulicella pectinivorans TaxID=474950 RepID=A0A1I6LZR2_9BACT|nr:Spy/CpxP family protein refolding chaperone [Granulicella pectinivorans]SFS08915.1 protein refolding chaperone Spy/CpxP family [Granulicella pectinivorans]